MNRGVIAALLISCVGVTGCTTTTQQVKVRAIPDPAAVLSRGGNEVAVARGQLALGNVGLALEGFRKAQRANPADPAPVAGIGDCYLSMGRLDLAQSSYEAALALAPHDPRLLLALASVFDREGQPNRAAQARADAEHPMPAAAAPMTAAVADAASATPAQEAQGALPLHASTGSITVELPPARPVDHLEARSSVPPLPPIEETATLSSTITVPLPPARPVPTSAPVAPPSPQALRPAGVASQSGPRLERLSRSEVALVTTGKPIWRAPDGSRTGLTGGVEWVALKPDEARPNVQVLNAAQSQGIAASARQILLNRGWRRIAIGNAPAARDESVVLYPRSRARLGRSLAAQFGVASRMVERDALVLVIGRDAIDRIAGQRKS